MLYRRVLIAVVLSASSIVAASEGSVGANGGDGVSDAVSAQSARLAVGGNHACVVLDGKVFCWGDNGSGQLGSSTDGSGSSNVPVEVTGISTAVAVATGWAHTCALLADGTVWCWGLNDSKQVGRNSVTDESPAPVLGLSGVTAIGLGNAHSCALIGSTGGVKCWGANGMTGPLLGRPTGNSNADADAVPDYVVGLESGVKRLAVGFRSACVVTTSSTVKCWGDNFDGGLGSGDRTSTGVTGPVSVVGLTDVAGITVGNSHTCAVTTAGKLWCWGYRHSGALGVGLGINDPTEWTNRGEGLTPLEVLTARGDSAKFTDAQMVSAGGNFTCAVRVNGAGACWGSNYQGELGNGGASITPVVAPIAVVDLAGATSISAGGSVSCALLSSNDVKCWGTTSVGQLGNGTNSGSYRPVSVTGVAPQSVAFGELADKAMGDAEFTVSATASSGGAVSFESTTTSVCTVAGSTVTLVGPGTCTISATRAAYGLYKAATSVSRSFKVAGVKPVVKTGTATPQSTKATLRGTVNPGGSDTTVNFVYGTDPALAGANTAKATVKTSLTDEEALAVVSDLKESTKYYFRIEASNAVGSASGDIGSFTTIGPEGVSINDGDEFTNSTSVTVSVVGPSNATKILISNDGGFKAAQPFNLTNSAAEIPWTLVSSRNGTFSKTVYVRFISRFDSKVTDDKTDDIILDTSKPSVTSVSASAGSAPSSAVEVSSIRGKASSGVKLSVRAVDTISGAVAIEVRSAANKPSTRVKLGKAPSKVKTIGMPRQTTATVSLKSTAKSLQIRAVDGAGNVSGWVKVVVKKR